MVTYCDDRKGQAAHVAIPHARLDLPGEELGERAHHEPYHDSCGGQHAYDPKQSDGNVGGLSDSVNAVKEGHFHPVEDDLCEWFVGGGGAGQIRLIVVFVMNFFAHFYTY